MNESGLKTQFTFLEFFAGGGMARIGLGPNWRCLLANDIDAAKCATYRENFGGNDLIEGNIADIPVSALPDKSPDLMWGSFPCQDLSLAGERSGLNGERSSAFFSFWSIAERLMAAGAGPKFICLENVIGLLTSNNGQDFKRILSIICDAGYQVSATIIDASAFTPQSRPRLFIIAAAPHLELPPRASSHRNGDSPLAHAISRLDNLVADNWFSIPAPQPGRRNIRFSDIVDWDAADWFDDDKTASLLTMMAPKQRARLDSIINSGARRYGAAFRRTRIENGLKVQRLEARFDGLAGCLRTPAGGSSRQIIIAIENGKVRMRLIAPREAAALMGLPPDYRLPSSDTAALKLCGDGVCAPVVSWLAENLMEPALAKSVAERVANRAA